MECGLTSNECGPWGLQCDDPEVGLVQVNEPAALWRNQFDARDLGAEDLEEHEVVDGIRAYELALLVNSKRGSAKKKGAKDREKPTPLAITHELERAKLYIVKEEGTKISGIATELDIEAQVLHDLRFSESGVFVKGWSLKS